MKFFYHLWFFIKDEHNQLVPDIQLCWTVFF